ncbi:uncharacterized protein LOC110989509 isoform X2 [Acanthaster planci]|uniref:Uncharacterized protein LOC110989509 isoform X2 n=1 Tax=Acanthaster planci TaxID=133434 RepID=A0A8B8A1B4_ACAPL|nr:uncharacterized protein LOC110989509 isoform X2 [Acanthaster planci]
MVTRFNDIVIITIHYISMCIHDSIVRSILSEFGEVIAGRFTTYGDNPTVFNGTRQYKMKLTKPIPTVLRIGDRNAWVSYPGQIRTCARCGEQGHYARDCTNTKCFKCLQIGHVAGDCPNQVICTICRMEGHSFRYCPKSFAKAVQPDRAWSSVSSNPSTSSGDQVAIAPDASSKEKGLKELPAGKCLKCKQSAGPFHPSICCFSCKLPLSFSKPFSILECAACKGVNGQPSLVCHRDSCKSVQAPESNDGFRVVRRRKRAAKRSSSPPVQPSTKKATPMPSSTGGGGETAPTAADIFGSDLDSVSSMDSCPARDPVRTHSSSSTSASDLSSSENSGDESTFDRDSTSDDEAAGIDSRVQKKVRQHLMALDLPGFSEPTDSQGRIVCCSLDGPDRIGTSTLSCDIGSQELQHLCDDMSLIDPWRVSHPNLHEYTWRNASNSFCSRFDRLYISNCLSCSSAVHLPVFFSDHDGAVLNLRPASVPERGKGFWKCNTSTLSDPIFQSDFKSAYVGWRLR